MTETKVEATDQSEHPFGVIMRWAMAHGARHIDKLPGCWERSVSGVAGGTWHVALNGHAEPVEVRAPDEGAVCDVAPFSAFVWWNGWPAGDIGTSGWSLAAGDAANEESFRAAIARDMP